MTYGTMPSRFINEDRRFRRVEVIGGVTYTAVVTKNRGGYFGAKPYTVNVYRGDKIMGGWDRVRCASDSSAKAQITKAMNFARKQAGE
jgi:hypothetical protein